MTTTRKCPRVDMMMEVLICTLTLPTILCLIQIHVRQRIGENGQNAQQHAIRGLRAELEITSTGSMYSNRYPLYHIKMGYA